MRERLTAPPLGERVIGDIAHWMADHLAVLETVARFASSDSERALYRAEIATCQDTWPNVRAQCVGVAEELIASTSGLLALEVRRRQFGTPKTAAKRLQLLTESQNRYKELLASVYARTLLARGERLPNPGNLYADAVECYSGKETSRAAVETMRAESNQRKRKRAGAALRRLGHRRARRISGRLPGAEERPRALQRRPLLSVPLREAVDVEVERRWVEELRHALLVRSPDRLVACGARFAAAHAGRRGAGWLHRQLLGEKLRGD
jgi:hypothetical protein